jgi:hypothetical protein
MKSKMPLEWTAAQTDKVVNTALDLIKIAFGAIFGAGLSRWQERKKTRDQQERKLSQLVLRVMANRIVNDLASELIAMRNFFLNAAPELLRSRNNQEFSEVAERSDYFTDRGNECERLLDQREDQ